MRVAVLGHNVTSNALGRAHILAEACRGFASDVALWGPPVDGDVWEPLRGDVEPRRYRVRDRPFTGLDRRRAADAVADWGPDAVYAVKPKEGSYGVARDLRRRHGVPLLLDVDDWELGFQLTGPRWKVVGDGLLHLRERESFFPTLWLDRRARREEHVTVSNTFLQDRFGGTLVPHFRDLDRLDPAGFDRHRIREEFGVAGKDVVLFFGTPRANKGLDVLVEAVGGIPGDDVLCLIVGAEPDNPHVRAFRHRDHVRIVGRQPFSRIPEVVLLADVYAVPQLREAGSRGQLPAKLVDAMAMARPIVATNVSDIPHALREGAGLVVEPDDPVALRDAIRSLVEDPETAQAMGDRARRRAREEYSLETMAARIRGLLEEVAAGAPGR